MTNPSADEPRFCTLLSRTVDPGEIVEINEAQASSLLHGEPNGFFVGYDPPDWDYHHAPRQGVEADSLDDLAMTFGTDKGPDVHNYTPLYTRHFADMRDRPVDLLEIGVFYGASLLMWEAWFAEGSITGVDIDPVVDLHTTRVTTVICDIKDYEPDRDFDIVIDDGSHDPDDITTAAKALLPRVRPGGWYVIEDLAVVPTDSSTFAWLRPLVENVAIGLTVPISEVHIYPQIVFLRRGDAP